jgi:hypothetical protein
VVGRTWAVTVFNSGRTAGVLKTVHYALVSEVDFAAGKVAYTKFDGRENIIPPEMVPGSEIDTGVYHDVIGDPKISVGYIEYKDVFGGIRTQGWKHRLHHDRPQSDALPGCYSDPIPKIP